MGQRILNISDRLKLIENALNWAAEGANRGVNIVSNNYGNTDKFTIYCSQSLQGYTYGEFVEDGRVINLDTGMHAEKVAKLQELQKELNL